jgi:hypothetical protein
MSDIKTYLPRFLREGLNAELTRGDPRRIGMEIAVRGNVPAPSTSTAQVYGSMDLTPGHWRWPLGSGLFSRRHRGVS